MNYFLRQMYAKNVVWLSSDLKWERQGTPLTSLTDSRKKKRENTKLPGMFFGAEICDDSEDNILVAVVSW